MKLILINETVTREIFTNAAHRTPVHDAAGWFCKLDGISESYYDSSGRRWCLGPGNLIWGIPVESFIIPGAAATCAL